MDWNAAIERNREALKRIVASLLAMAAVTGGGATLPRHLHRAVLRLLRPAEAAARRLVIVAAREIVLPPPAPPRPRKPKAKPAILRNGVGTGIVLPASFPPQAGLDPIAARKLALPLIDPLPRWRHRRPAASGIPRISFPGFGAPPPVPVRRPPSSSDPIEATRLALRLAAMASALDDLPAHARRFARWRSRLKRGLVRRISPLRPGRPPGHRPANDRRPAHEIHELLADLQWFAFKALEQPDTS